jgi:hypothetical protein
MPGNLLDLPKIAKHQSPHSIYTTAIKAAA